MRRIAFVCLVALALAGCALPAERLGPEERWGLSENRTEGAKLALGVPGTDDVRLMMTCRPHGGEVKLTIVARRGDPAVVELHSGDLWKRYGGVGHDDEETLGGFDIDLRLPATDPQAAMTARSAWVRRFPNITSARMIAAFHSTGATYDRKKRR